MNTYFHNPSTRELLQKILDEKCPGVILHILEHFETNNIELRFCGPATKSIWAEHSVSMEQLGTRINDIMDEFIVEARAMEVEHLDEIYNYDS